VIVASLCRREALLAEGLPVHALRDLTAGLASALTEIARASGLELYGFQEWHGPWRFAPRCGQCLRLFGLDPLAMPTNGRLRPVLPTARRAKPVPLLQEPSLASPKLSTVSSDAVARCRFR